MWDKNVSINLINIQMQQDIPIHQTKLFINNRFVDGVLKQQISLTNPVTEEEICKVYFFADSDRSQKQLRKMLKLQCRQQRRRSTMSGPRLHWMKETNALTN
jgi:hypothetical protein